MLIVDTVYITNQVATGACPLSSSRRLEADEATKVTAEVKKNKAKISLEARRVVKLEADVKGEVFKRPKATSPIIAMREKPHLEACLASEQIHLTIGDDNSVILSFASAIGHASQRHHNDDPLRYCV